ncbi:MAG: ribonuclease HI [Lachnospiraceae bacterium]|nr:ribonuclease HI [Lachnospiraceae bacterium]
MRTSMPVEIYTDGSSIKNPGPAGIAYIIRFYEEPADDMSPPTPQIIEFNQGYRLSTNNRMEISAAIQGLSRVIYNIGDQSFEGVNQINLYTDSDYLSNAINQGWLTRWMQNNWMTAGFRGAAPKPVKNKDLWEQVSAIQDKLKQLGINFTIHHVKGHNGDEFNERADKLAVEASTGTNHLIDEVYEKVYSSSATR